MSRKTRPPLAARLPRPAALDTHSDAPGVARGVRLPSLAELLDVRAPYLAPLLLVLVTRIAAWFALPYAAEDAYITFRYARNLATGVGAVFDADRYVMGFTSAPWMLWNAAGFLLTRAIEPWARATLLASDLLLVVLAVSLLTRAAGRAAAWTFALFFALWPYFSALSASGMENGVLATLVLLAAGLAHGHHLASGPVLALLALWRPEGLVCAALVALAASWRDRLVALALTLAGLGALAYVYGSPLPQSLLAKSTLYGTPGPWAGRHWWEWLAPGPLGRWPITGEGNLLLPFAALLAPAFVAGLVRLWRSRAEPLALAAAALLAVWLGYSLLGVAYFFWYLAAPVTGMALVAAVGFPHLVRGRALPVTALLALLALWSVAPSLYVGRAQIEYLSFATAGRYLREHARPGQSVMLEPIGTIGWLAPLRIIDEVGLVAPEVARRRLRGPGWYSDVVTDQRPDWLVLRAGMLRSGAAFAGAGSPFRDAVERDSVFARYAIALGDPARGDQSLLVLRRAR